MTQFTESFETGTAGTNITTSNTMFGGNINNAGTPTTTFSATGHQHGSLCMRIVGATGDASKPYKDFGADSIQCADRFYLYMNSLPAVAHDFGQFHNNAFSGVSTVSFGAGSSANKFLVKDAAGTILDTYATALSVTTGYRIERYCKPGTTTSNGTSKVKLFIGDSTTVTYSYTSAVINAGTLPLRRCAYGKMTPTGAWDISIDDVKIDTALTDATIGPVTANVAPSVSVGATQHLAAPATVNVSGTLTDSDGTIKTATWTYISGPDLGITITTNTSNLNTASCTATAAIPLQAGQHKLRLVGTDNNDVYAAPAANGDLFIYIAALANVDVKVFAKLSGSYSLVNGSDPVVILNDTDPTSLLRSADAPASDHERVQMNPYNLGDIALKVTAAQSVSSPPISVQVTAFKEDNTTQVYQTTLTGWTTTQTEQVVTIDSTGAAMLPDLQSRRALIWDVSATQ